MVVALPFAAMAKAQVAVGVEVGPDAGYAPDAGYVPEVGVGPEVVYPPAYYPAPVCEWGYYSYYPYTCAPYGYYGSEWFRGGVFIGAGPWFHGDDNFHGRVNNRYHPEHGYHGAMPARGEKAEPSRRLDKVSHFKGNESRDGRGHTGGDRK